MASVGHAGSIPRVHRRHRIGPDLDMHSSRQSSPLSYPQSEKPSLHPQTSPSLAPPSSSHPRTSPSSAQASSLPSCPQSLRRIQMKKTNRGYIGVRGTVRQPRRGRLGRRSAFRYLPLRSIKDRGHKFQSWTSSSSSSDVSSVSESLTSTPYFS